MILEYQGSQTHILSLDSQTPSLAALQNLSIIDSNPENSKNTDMIMPSPTDAELFDDVHVLCRFLTLWHGDPHDHIHYMLRLKALKKLVSEERSKLSCILKRMIGLLRTKNEGEQREKLELAIKFINGLSLSDIRKNIIYLRSLVPDRERYDLSLILERIIYIMRNMAKRRPEHREKLGLAESYIYQRKDQQEVLSIIMSLK